MHKNALLILTSIALGCSFIFIGYFFKPVLHYACHAKSRMIKFKVSTFMLLFPPLHSVAQDLDFNFTRSHLIYFISCK